MSKRWKIRSRRRKLAAHDRGENRHNSGLAWMLKKNRQAAERNRLKQERKSA